MVTEGDYAAWCAAQDREEAALNGLTAEARAWLRLRAVALQEWPGEWRFAVGVLGRVRGLPWSQLEYQWDFYSDLDHRARRADFSLKLPGGRLVLEVDGWDKTGQGRGMSREELADFLTRQNSLVLGGATVLRFSNDQVSSDPEGCARVVSAAVERLKSPGRDTRGDMWQAVAAALAVWWLVSRLAGW